MFGAKTLVDLLGRESDSALMVHRHGRAAAIAMISAAACFPIARLAVRDGSNEAAIAVIVSTYLTTYASSRRFERLKRDQE